MPDAAAAGGGGGAEAGGETPAPSPLKAYITGPVGLAKIATIVAAAASFVAIVEASSGASALSGGKPCGGSCPMSKAGCPNEQNAWLVYTITLISLIASAVALIALIIAFEQIMKLSFIKLIDILGHVAAAILMVICAYLCVNWRSQANSKFRCEGDSECEARRDGILNPTMFLVTGVVTGISGLVYLVAVFMIVRS